MNIDNIEFILAQLEQIEQKIDRNSETDSLDTKIHRNIYKYMLSHLEEKPLFKPNTAIIFHSLFLKPSDNYTDSLELNSYRTIDTAPVTLNHVPPNWKDVSHFMDHYLNQINTSKGIFPSIEYAVLCHKRFLDISPFASYNLQISFYILNYFLLSEHKICFLPSNKETYLNALTSAQHPTSPNIDSLLQYITDYCFDVSF